MSAAPNRRALTMGSLALTLVLSGAASQVEAQDRYSLSGREVEVHNLVGTVTVGPASGNEVVVDVSLRGADASQLSVETGEIRGRNALRVIFPHDRIVYPEMGRSRIQVRYREDGTWNDDWRGGRRLTVTGRGRGTEAYADLEIQVPTGQYIVVYLAVGEVTVSNTDGEVYIDTGAAPVVSRNTKGLISIDVGSGRVSVEDAEGEVEIDTGSGSVEVYRVQADRLYVDTGSGRVRGGDLTAREVIVDTGSGSVTLQAVTSRDIEVDTGSGSVDVELLTDVDHLLVDTGSGGVTLILPGDLGADIEIDTGSGGIDVDFPVRVTRWERSYMRGSIGDGQGRIQVDTGSGGVRLRQG